MKKIFLLLFVISLSGSISCGMYNSVSDITEQVYIGMSKAEFLKVAKKRAEADAIYIDYYVYRINQYDLNGYKIDSMFYYFYTSTDTLFEVNSGSLKK